MLISHHQDNISKSVNASFIDPLLFDSPHSGHEFDTLKPCSVDEVLKLIRTMPAKSSAVDTIPTSLLKSCADIFAPIISRLVNLSFKEGVFPTSFKTASVTPLLKKKGLDCDNCANFRPISNFHTISKLTERLFYRV